MDRGHDHGQHGMNNGMGGNNGMSGNNGMNGNNGFQIPNNMAPPPLMNQPPQIFGGYNTMPELDLSSQMFGDVNLMDDSIEAKRRRIARVCGPLPAA